MGFCFSLFQQKLVKIASIMLNSILLAQSASLSEISFLLNFTLKMIIF